MQTTSRFKATLKLPQIIALYIGAVLGSGILIIPGVAAELSGPASLLAWGLMMVLVLPMALTMGLLSSKYPNAGGVSHFVTEAFNPQLGSLIGWFFTLSVAIGAPVLTLTGAGYLCAALDLGETCRLSIAVAILLSGLLTNYFGIKLTGWIQIAVVLTTLTFLITTIAGSFSKIDIANFHPFMPNGWSSVGSTSTILFWCFLGWEAVSNMSEEFHNPRRDAIVGTIIAAVIVSVIYFLTALAIVGTHSYGRNISDVSLIHIIKGTYGKPGAVIAGFAALFVCLAPAIAYIGAIARMVFSLSEKGYAPKALSYVSEKHKSPLGGLFFLAVCFTLSLIVFSTRIVSLATLLQVPNVTFILTYIGGCAAGVKLLKDSKLGILSSLISLLLSTVILAFVKWNIVFPVVITALWFCFMLSSTKRRPIIGASDIRP